MNYLTFIRENARWLSGGFLLCLFSSFGQTFFISLSGGHIRSAYGLSNGEWGSLYMFATLASALTLPVLGRIVDYMSVAKTALLVIPMLAAACLLMSLSTHWLILIVTIYLLRLFGQGMMTHISITAMGRWYSGHRGRAVSIATLGHQAGEAVFPIFMIALFLAIGWRNSWALFAGFLVLGALPIVYFTMRLERQPRTTDKQEIKRISKDWTRAEVLRDPMFWLLLLGVLAPAFIGTTIFFHQSYLLELRGWAPDAFASAFMVMASMTILFALLSGYMVDRFGSLRILPVGFLPLSLACFALYGIDQEFGIYIFMGLLGISYGISSTLFGVIWPEVYGASHLGAIRSVTVAFMVFASAMGPGVTGLLIDAGVSYPSQIFVMGFYCLTVSVIMLFVARKLRARVA
ncbi:MAG: MFS transporter [Rhizobiaceae bacterium]